MPELDFFEENDPPYSPDTEYPVELDGVTYFVSFSGFGNRSAFVRLSNGDYLDAKVYRERNIKPSQRQAFFRAVRYLRKEFAIG